ncbi:MAG: hypothetical protein ACOVRN_17400 [Flavobacterium sp.]
MKQLSAEQIDQLYIFVQNNGVHYYDLQTELVDHLANHIESQWAYHQNPDFNDALSFAYSGFEKNSFTTLVAARTKALLKKHMRFVRSCFVSFFTFPKLIVTVALFFSLHSIFLLDAKFEIPFFQLSMIAIQMICAGIIKISARNFEKRLKRKEKVWLLEQLVYKSTTMPATLFITGISFQFTDNFNGPGVVAQWVLSGIFTLVFLHNYIVLYVIPYRAEEYLRDTYPEYDLV